MTTGKALRILTPVGRIVQGDVWKPNTTDFAGQPLTIRSGPNQGQARVNYFLALAIRKDNPELPALIATITLAAQQGFPTLFDTAGNLTAPKFAWKMVDGDGTVADEKGRKPCDREGYPGHIIFKFSTGIQPKRVATGGDPEIIDPTQIKCGDYVRIAGSVVGNSSPQPNNAGVFLNWNMVEFQAVGEAILTGPDPKEVFGGTAPALPPGVNVTPPSVGVPGAASAATVPPQPVTAAAPGHTGMQPLPQGVFPGQPAATPPAAAVPPAPHPGILTPPAGQPRTFDERLTPKAQGASWAALVAAGWDEPTAIREGLMVNDVPF